jgi:hypothetical protein
MKKMWIYAVVSAAALALPRVALASSIVVSLGNTAPTNALAGGAPLVSGNVYGDSIIDDNFVAPFFTGFCGSEGNANPALDSNCDKSWTFNFVIPAGETITGATLSVGLWDVDSKASGDQIGLYQVNGGDVLTSALNTAAEALNGATGAKNAEYDVFTFALSNFGPLSGGSATVHLMFQGPGAGVLVNPPVPTNAGAILFSTLNITTTADTQPPPGTVPEPASLLLLATGMGAGLGSRIRRALRRR